MRNVLVASLLMLVGWRSGLAQNQFVVPYPPGVTNLQSTAPWVVKFAPLALIDPDNAVEFGIERRLGNQQSAQVELGYGWQGMNLWQNSQNQRYTDKEVWRGRAEWRHYFDSRRQLRGNYIAIEGFYKQVNVRESGTVGVGCDGGPCQYYQIYSSPTEKYVWGGHVKFGNQSPLSFYNRHWLIDWYVGLGIRRRTVERFGRPDGLNYYASGGYSLFDSFSSATYVLPSMTLGVKVGYAF